MEYTSKNFEILNYCARHVYIILELPYASLYFLDFYTATLNLFIFILTLLEFF